MDRAHAPRSLSCRFERRCRSAPGSRVVVRRAAHFARSGHRSCRLANGVPSALEELEKLTRYSAHDDASPPGVRLEGGAGRVRDKAVAQSIQLRAFESHDRKAGGETDRKSTRLNSSHMSISYAVFCLKKKKEQ